MSTENTAETPVEEKVVREQANGVTKPAEGTKTRQVWDTADAISAEIGRPALMAEVREKLGEGVNKATISTQYNKWCTFYGVTAEQRKEARAEIKAAKDAEAKAAKEAEKAAAAAAKADEEAAGSDEE